MYHRDYTSNYNLEGKIKEADTSFFEQPDLWRQKRTNIPKEKLNETVDEMTKDLLEYAKQRVEALNLDIDIDIDVTTNKTN